ncbi:MAG: hypothetical protein QXX09_03285 [Candidatus Methanomethylicia archaeon]
MERFSYRYTFSKRAQRLYEDYAEVRAWFDELRVLRSGRTAYDYVDKLLDEQLQSDYEGSYEKCACAPHKILNLFWRNSLRFMSSIIF